MGYHGVHAHIRHKLQPLLPFLPAQIQAGSQKRRASLVSDHYFRHLYRIYKFVDTSCLIEDDERYEYTCIIRSQLSEYELVMLFYNCLTPNGREKFKPLIEKYSVFKNLRYELLAKPRDREEYAQSAYKRFTM